jgi:DNA helicase-2/ATP-dependent DNA helicase PcrA
MMDLETLLQGLNNPQRQAVTTTEGRVLVLAGAGSGKTKVLMSRIAYLIATGKTPPEKILGLTFTNKAAHEMRERLALLIGAGQAKRVTLCTFHSFCLKWLRQEAHRLGFTRRFSLYHEHDVRRLIQQMIREELEHEGQLPSIAPTLERIDKARQLGLKPRELPPSEEIWHHEFCDRLFERLQQAFRAYDAMDFNALIEYCVDLAENNEEARQSLLERFRYVMIDEYQDTNPIQDLLAKLLAGHGNLCVVGDDDQSIYGWRGGQVRNILEFEADAVIKLEQNYRSSGLILKAANEVIAKNTQRFQKTLWSNHEGQDKLEVFHAPGENQEAKAVVERLVKLKSEKGYKWRDFAILYRSNALARAFESALIQQVWQENPEGAVDGAWRRGIPYEVFGGDSFYDCREVRDLVAYMRLVCNPKDMEAALRVINQPRRGIGEATVDALTSPIRKTGGTLFEQIEQSIRLGQFNHPITESLKSFAHTMEMSKERFSQFPLADSMRWLLEVIDYEKAIKEEVKSETMRELKRKNLEQLIQSAQAFEKECQIERPQLNGLDLVTEFISSAQVDPGSSFSGKNRREDAVHLMTFHSAKGLEFPAVYLVGLEDHILPHERSMQDTGLEEERRLFYVALTRAKRYLTLSMSTVRERYGKPQASQPSRFLFDIPQDIMRITRFDQK